MVNLGPAVGAVDERVPEPPVGRIGELAQAVRAGRGVRRHQGPAPPGGPSGPGGPAASLAAMAKDADRLGVMALVVTRSILASGGASRSSRRRNSLTAAAVLRPRRTPRRGRCRRARSGPGRSPGCTRTGGSRPPGRPPPPGSPSGSAQSPEVCLPHRRSTSRSVTSLGPGRRHPRCTPGVQLTLPRGPGPARACSGAPRFR